MSESSLSSLRIACEAHEKYQIYFPKRRRGGGASSTATPIFVESTPLPQFATSMGVE
jgi:hypothetical protein